MIWYDVTRRKFFATYLGLVMTERSVTRNFTKTNKKVPQSSFTSNLAYSLFYY